MLSSESNPIAKGVRVCAELPTTGRDRQFTHLSNCVMLLEIQRDAEDKNFGAKGRESIQQPGSDGSREKDMSVAVQSIVDAPDVEIFLLCSFLLWPTNMAHSSDHRVAAC